jgi:hypothetical protein
VRHHRLKGGKGHVVGPVFQPIRVRYAVRIRHEYRSSFGDPVHAARQLTAFEVKGHERADPDSNLRRPLTPRDEIVGVGSMEEEAGGYGLEAPRGAVAGSPA